MGNGQEKPDQPMADLDLAMAIGTEILESGQIDPAYRELLCEPETRAKLIPDLVACITTKLKPVLALRQRQHLMKNMALLTQDVLVHMSSVMPSADHLLAEFNELSCYFCRFKQPWHVHDSCIHRDLTASDLWMRLVLPNQTMTVEELIQEMDEKGYRPAIHTELYAFGCKRFVSQHWITALGSYVVESEQDRFVAILFDNGKIRLLRVEKSRSTLLNDPHRRFLFVKK